MMTPDEAALNDTWLALSRPRMLHGPSAACSHDR